MGGNIFDLIKNILFPVYCSRCEQEGSWFCDNCLSKEKISLVLKCPVCAKNNTGELCLGCRGFFPLDGMMAIFSYTEKIYLTKLIQAYKYQYAVEIGEIWREFIKRGLLVNEVIKPYFSDAVLMPVPLHPTRLRERGFNQSELIGDILLDELTKEGILVKKENNILKRIKKTKQQARLSKDLRQVNIKDAFAVNSGLVLPYDNVVLIDDVFTSGATLMECARVLKSAGVKKVLAFCLARGEMS